MRISELVSTARAGEVPGAVGIVGRYVASDRKRRTLTRRSSVSVTVVPTVLPLERARLRLAVSSLCHFGSPPLATMFNPPGIDGSRSISADICSCEGCDVPRGLDRTAAAPPPLRLRTAIDVRRLRLPDSLDPDLKIYDQKVNLIYIYNTPFALDTTRSGLWKPSGKSQFSPVRVGPYING